MSFRRGSSKAAPEPPPQAGSKRGLSLGLAALVSPPTSPRRGSSTAPRNGVGDIHSPVPPDANDGNETSDDEGGTPRLDLPSPRLLLRLSKASSSTLRASLSTPELCMPASASRDASHAEFDSYLNELDDEDEITAFSNVHLSARRVPIPLTVRRFRSWSELDSCEASDRDTRRRDRTIKLLLIGDCGCGKTSVLLRFVENSFSESYVQTIGVDFKPRMFEFVDPIVPAVAVAAGVEVAPVGARSPLVSPRLGSSSSATLRSRGSTPSPPAALPRAASVDSKLFKRRASGDSTSSDGSGSNGSPTLHSPRALATRTPSPMHDSPHASTLTLPQGVVPPNALPIVSSNVYLSVVGLAGGAPQRPVAVRIAAPPSPPPPPATEPARASAGPQAAAAAASTSPRAASFKVSVPIGISRVHIQVWDTAGQSRFRSMTTSYYRGADGIMIVYDLTDPKGFAQLSKWLDETRQYGRPKLPVLIFGAKLDLTQATKTTPEKWRPRCVTYAEAQLFACEQGVQYAEGSSKTDRHSVELAFASLIERVVHGEPHYSRESALAFSASASLASFERPLRSSSSYGSADEHRLAARRQGGGKNCAVA